MYRQRLKSKQGCLRCKQRHAKCDEVKPACSFCRRWSRVCTWPDVTTTSRARRSNSRKLPQSRIVAAILPSETVKSSGLCRLHKLTDSSRAHAQIPAWRGETEQSRIFAHLQQFLFLIVRQNLPFKGIKIRNSMVHGWFESALRDEAACFALLTHWAEEQARVTGCPEMRLLALKYEVQATGALRQRIESGNVLTEEALLAAAIHYMSTAFNVSEPSQLDTMLHGMKALIDHFGGIRQIVAEMEPSTVFSVQHTDIFNALVNAKKPKFVHLDRPDRPESFPSALDGKKIRSRTNRIPLASDVLDAIESIEFLLFFRKPSQQARLLSDEEHHYLCLLEYWLNYQLSLLQFKYTGTVSVHELMLVALVVVKTETVAKECSHTILTRTLLSRLRSAIDMYRSVFQKDDLALAKSESLIIWICIVALVGPGLPSERSWFACNLQATLIHRYGEHPTRWPYGIETQLRDELLQYPWHARIDHCLISICADMRKQVTS